MRAPACLLLLAVAACEQQLPPQPVPYADDVTMVPLPRTDATCPEYRMESPTRFVVQAIFYRNRDGTFTMNRAEACPAR